MNNNCELKNHNIQNNLQNNFQRLSRIFIEYCNKNDLVGDIKNSTTEYYYDLNGLIDNFNDSRIVFLRYCNLDDLIGDFTNQETENFEFCNLNDVICNFINSKNIFSEYSNLNDLIGDFEKSKNTFIKIKKITNYASCKSTIQINNANTSDINILEYDIEDYNTTINMLKLMYESDEQFKEYKKNYSDKVIAKYSSPVECFFIHYFNNNARRVSFLTSNIHQNLLKLNDYSDIVPEIFEE